MNPALFLRRRTELINVGSINPDGIKEIVALELMTRIAEKETGKSEQEEKTNSPREYYLTLYSQCIRTVSGEDIEDVFEEEI